MTNKTNWEKYPLGHEVIYVRGIPKRTSELITLLTLDLGVSRAQAARDLITKALTETDANIDTLLLRIATRIVQTYLFGKSRLTFQSYRTTQKSALRKHGVSSYFLDKIMMEVSKQYAAHKKSLNKTK